jgi:hypothetical protein
MYGRTLIKIFDNPRPLRSLDLWLLPLLSATLESPKSKYGGVDNEVNKHFIKHVIHVAT